MSASCRPVRSSNRGTVMAGAISNPSSGWTAAYSIASMKASGSSPSSAARRSLIRSTAEAPSDTGDALPAVMVPSGSNAGFRTARRSIDVSGRGPVSWATPSTDTISCARCGRAASAFRWLARATSSCRARGMFHSARVSSMCWPMVRPVVGSRNVAGSAPLSHSTPPAIPALMRPRPMASAMTVAVRSPVMQ